MDKRIIAPPKLYLDTNHLINIAKLRRGEALPSGKFTQVYGEIDEHIRTGVCGIIFNPAAPLEWVEGNATRASANRIAAVVDSAKLSYEMEMDRFIWVQEVLQECKRVEPCIHVPTLPIMHPRILGQKAEKARGILADRVPGYFDECELPTDAPKRLGPIPFETVRKYVELAMSIKQQRPDAYRERIEGFRAGLSRDIERAKPLKNLRNARIDVVGWMKRYLRVPTVLRAANPDVDADALLNRIDVRKCPAVSLFVKARDKRMRAAYEPADSEGDDWSFLPTIPYADTVLTDRHFRAMIHQADPSMKAKVTSDPSEAVTMMRRWVT